MSTEVPRILVNMKAYLEASCDRALSLARAAEKVSLETGVLVGIIPDLLSAPIVAREVDIPVLVQHVDPVEPGAFTGSISPRFLRHYGISGSLLNHSERRVRLDHIASCVRMLSEERLVSVVCCTDPFEAGAVASLNPSAVAVEPPDLIGTRIPVSRARPEVVTEAVKAVRRHSDSALPICGAGITTGEDVRRAIELGSHGVLVASAVVKADDPEKKIREFASSVFD